MVFLKKMKSVGAGLLVLLLAFTGCSRKASATAENAISTVKSGVLMVGMEIGYPPMEYFDTDGKTLLGFDVDLGKAVAKKLGLQVEFVNTTWDDIFVGLDTGKYDCIMSTVTLTSEREAVYNFTKPYIGNAQALVLLKDTLVKAKSPEELADLRVAYQAETTSDIYMTKLAADGLVFEPFEYEHAPNCFDDLKLGRVDAVVCDSLLAVSYITPENAPFQIIWQGPADEVLAISLRKGNDALTSMIDKALEELFESGDMLKISQNIFKMDMVSSVHKLFY